MEDKPRLTIQGWYHASQPPVGADMASLKQVMSKGESTLAFDPIDIGPQRSPASARLLSPKDVEALAQWLNPVYLQPDTMKSIHKKFCKESSIQLQSFLKESLSQSIAAAALHCDTCEHLGQGRRPPSYVVGVRGGWKLVGPPHKRRHLQYTSNPNDNSNGNSNSDGKMHKEVSNEGSCGVLLSQVYAEMFRSAAFARYLRALTTLTPTAVRGEVRRFRPGLDYTVAYYGAMSDCTRLDATLCFVDCTSEGAQELWEDGDAGGFECYMAADDTDSDAADAAEVYRTDTTDEDQLLSVSPGCNVLNLVMRDKGTMKFVKYVGAIAPGSRWDVTVEYDLLKQEGEEESGMQEEEVDDDQIKKKKKRSNNK